MALTFMLGCSADNIMGPGSVSTPADGSDGGSYFSIVPDPQGKSNLNVQGASLVKGTATLVSAKKGGAVSLGRFTLEIPPGALDADTHIKISVPDPSMVVCELEPHGLQFNKQVTLTVNYGGTVAEQLESSKSTLGVYWYNEATGRWQLVGKGLDPDRNLTQAKLEHFSKYGGGWTGG
jgi:hypothetical protein